VSRVDMKTFDSPASIIFVTNSCGARYAMLASPVFKVGRNGPRPMPEGAALLLHWIGVVIDSALRR
jgi:hypothetical protein